MNFIHAEEYLDDGDIVVVNSSHQCNVRVMDDANFEWFRRDSQHEYYGGAYKRFPARIQVPRSGRWHVTLDLGGGNANIRYGISYIKTRAA